MLVSFSVCFKQHFKFRHSHIYIFLRFKVVHILSSPSSNWTGESGRLSLPLLTKYIPNSSEDVRVFISGPALFSRTIVE